MKSFNVIILFVFFLCVYFLYENFIVISNCNASDEILLCSSADSLSTDRYRPSASPWETKTLGPGKVVDNGKLIDMQLPPQLPSHRGKAVMPGEKPGEIYAPVPNLDLPPDPVPPPPSSPPGGRRVY